MEDSGAEVTKRQRLDPLTGISAIGVHSQQQHPALPQQQQQSPLPQHTGSPASEGLHGYANPQPTLAPPNAYAEPVPPSPYQAVPETRALSEHPGPGAAAYAHGLPHSGYTTPVREAHAPLPDRAPLFSRNGHHHPPPLRDPNEVTHPGAIRPHSSNFDAEGHVYQPASAHDAADPGASPYGAHEPTTNGIFHHGLPMAPPHDPSQQPPPPPANVVQYAEASGGAVGHAPQGGPPYSAGPYPPHSPWNRPPMPPRKPARALQVIISPFRPFSCCWDVLLGCHADDIAKACETCRQRKAKCDEGKPICGYCRENRHPCHYKEVQPAKCVVAWVFFLFVREQKEADSVSVGPTGHNAKRWTSSAAWRAG